MKPFANVYTGVVTHEDPQVHDPQRAMLDATPDCVKMLTLDGRVLTMNRAGCQALGVAEDAVAGMQWLGLLPPEVRAAGEAALRKAAAGESVRFPGRSVSPAGTLFWDNLLLPITGGGEAVLSILCVSRDVTEITLMEQQLHAAVQREQLLAHEMRHRIKNLFSVVSGLTYIAQRELRGTGTAQDMAAVLRDKLAALSRASDAVFAQADAGADAAASDLAALAGAVLQPYGARCTLSGPAASVHSEAMTTLALILHELATNSVKYGALGMGDGHVALHWSLPDGVLEMVWTETGGPQVAGAPGRAGFGGEMVDRILQSARGSIERTWRVEGLVVVLRLPRVACA
ncbi:PAS domain-containing protein [Pseudorhodoferax sp. LjRoot39]|uniref:sensor histidine kinase n=1 Tax=Pseudorhodoferax sp. LjRoot39 TaxID=3342328 RepID=UPI003ECC6244